MTTVAAPPPFQLRSLARARQRWEVPWLTGRSDRARDLARALVARDGVTRAEANPATGRVLIHLRDGIVDPVGFVRRALGEALDHVAPPRPPAHTATRVAGVEGEAGNALFELLAMFPPDPKYTRVAPTWSIIDNILNFLPELGLVGIVNVVNKGSPKFLTALGLRTMPAQLVALGVLTAAAFGAELVAERKKREAWRRMSRDIEHRVRAATYAHVQKLDQATIEDRSSINLVRVMSEHMATINRFLETGADDMFQRGITALIIVATLLAISPVLALTTLVPLPVIMIGARYVQRKTSKPYQEMAEVNDALNKILSNNLSDLATIKSFTAETVEAGRLTAVSARVRDTSDQAVTVSSRYTDLMRGLISLSFVVSVTAGGFLVAGEAISAALFTLLLFFVPKLLVRMEGMGEGYDMYKNAVASSREVLALLRAEPTIVAGPKALPAPEVKGAIEFSHIDFGYRADAPLFADFNLKIPQHQTAAFVGSTGSGKSSLVKLVMRFYDVRGGSILLDGEDLRNLDLTDLRRAVGFVSQDVYLFDGTIGENIRYGRPDATFEEVVEAARAAEAHAFIEALPEGYETPVGERGKRLSGGQRQRVSIARTVLKNPPVLILDEATSAVDNETEAAIQRSIERISKGRTTIMIAHRLSTVRNADVIHVLEDGRIVESGDHAGLLRKRGIYAGLWKVQTGETVKRSRHPVS